MSPAKQQNLGWVLMFALAALYIIGFIIGWAQTASWHLLLVIVAILLLFNIFSRRGR